MSSSSHIGLQLRSVALHCPPINMSMLVPFHSTALSRIKHDASDFILLVLESQGFTS